MKFSRCDRCCIENLPAFRFCFRLEEASSPTNDFPGDTDELSGEESAAKPPVR